jgi:hypothetical protein
MLGIAIASSLVHEVGHQGAALLELNDSLRRALNQSQRSTRTDAAAWRLWERWISEITADLWSIARIGVGSTLGLMGVVSLPRAFVFRINTDDPHPTPWLRVRLSCALGGALYPDGQWERLSRLWAEFYPLNDQLSAEQRKLITALERTMPEFVRLLLAHRPPALHGEAIADALRAKERTPDRLRATWRGWSGSFERMRSGAPSLVFAVFGQARADGLLSPEEESRMLADLLTFWALRQALATTEFAAKRVAARPALAAAT